MNPIVSPFAKIIEVIFLGILTFINNYGVALILLSVIVNILLYPFYKFAEKIEKKEKDVQKRMKPKLDEFKSVYKGYELYLYTNNVYRLNEYHPAYALRGLVSLMIQIPFFMGAYAFLSAFSGFEGATFLFLTDLSKPDALLTLGSLSINILPFIMTAINLWAGYIYSKDGETTEKITIIVIAIFFLVILYSSPSSLLLYWTCNNVFSLFKNIVTKRKEEKELSGGIA